MVETIIAELYRKVDGFLTSQEIEALDAGAVGARPAKTPIAHDAVAALIALGQTRQEAEVQVTRAIGKLGTRPGSVEQVLERVFGGN